MNKTKRLLQPDLNRLISYCMALAAIALFVLSPQTNAVLLMTAILLSVIVALASFFLNWSTLDSILAIVVIGSVILGFAGWWPALALFFFFSTSSLMSAANRKEYVYKELTAKTGRRDGYQVWSNGFWVVLFVLLWTFYTNDSFLIAAFAALAVATGDTWATEVGIRKPGRTTDILSREPVEPGIDGGVSRNGFIAALAGSVAIALLAVPAGFAGSAIITFLTITIAGFAGVIIDSVLGSFYLSKEMNFPFFGTSLVKAANGKNNLVNWLSTGAGGILALIIHTMI